MLIQYELPDTSTAALIPTAPQIVTGKQIPCSVQDYVFDDINKNAQQDVFCASNSNYNEVMWFYASANSDQIDRMVIYNYAENLWYIGTLARTSWSDYGVYPVPYATQFLSTDTTATISTITGLKAGRTFVFLHETVIVTGKHRSQTKMF